MATHCDVETPLAAPTLEENARKNDGLLKLSPYLILLVTTLVYLTSFQGAFVFDDYYYVDKPYVKQLWPPWISMTAPDTISRPLLGLSLAVNYAISGREPWSYHLLNLLIHLVAALALFGVVRHTLLNERLRPSYARASTALALVVALVWAVHPLNTQAVTYIIQRVESMMGMFYLLTMYCAIRSFQATQKRWWYVAAMVACTAGMLSKQVMATAPLMVLLYDWLFIASSWKEVWVKRWRLHVGLLASWLVLGLTLVLAPVNPTAGFAVKVISPWDYFKSEFAVIVHYLRLSLWPQPLVLDYNWPRAQGAGDIVPYALLVGGLVLLSLWGLSKRKAWSFAGVWFFLILSMTSTIMPFEDLAFEHRMYLSLAGVVSLLVLGGYGLGKRLLGGLRVEQQGELGRKLGFVVSLLLVSWLGFWTAQRNYDYQSDIGMWRDVVNKRPQNPRGHNNVGTILMENQVDDEALAQFLEAIRYNPYYADAHTSAGWLLSKRGDLEEGKWHLAEALKIKPTHGIANFYRGKLYLLEGDNKAAIESFSKTIEVIPNHEAAYFNLGKVWEKEGNFAEAIQVYRNLLQINQRSTSVMGQLALVLATSKDEEQRNLTEAQQLAETAVSLSKGEQPLPLEALAATHAELKRFPQAIEAAQKALYLASTVGDQETVVRLDARIKQYKENQKL
jgi:tetratricopeptide (TPR) repeat protein